MQYLYTSITYSQGNTVLLQPLLYNATYINLIDKGNDDCLASAKLDVIEHDNNVIMADVNGPKLPPKPQPNIGEIKLLLAAECEDTAQDVLPPSLPLKSGDLV